MSFGLFKHFTSTSHVFLKRQSSKHGATRSTTSNLYVVVSVFVRLGWNIECICVWQDNLLNILSPIFIVIACLLHTFIMLFEIAVPKTKRCLIQILLKKALKMSIPLQRNFETNFTYKARFKQFACISKKFSVGGGEVIFKCHNSYIDKYVAIYSYQNQ